MIFECWLCKTDDPSVDLRMHDDPEHCLSECVDCGHCKLCEAFDRCFDEHTSMQGVFEACQVQIKNTQSVLAASSSLLRKANLKIQELEGKKSRATIRSSQMHRRAQQAESKARKKAADEIYKYRKHWTGIYAVAEHFGIPKDGRSFSDLQKTVMFQLKNQQRELHAIHRANKLIQVRNERLTLASEVIEKEIPTSTFRIAWNALFGK